MGQARVYPWEAPVTVKEELFTVLADQIATVNKTRLTAFVDHLSADDLRRVDVAMRKQLGL
jgi:mRNA-degrading endonuclease toxin of MazEF toxin-antitoxin module